MAAIETTVHVSSPLRPKAVGKEDASTNPHKLFEEDADEVANVLKALGSIQQSHSRPGSPRRTRRKSTSISQDNVENDGFSPSTKGRRASNTSYNTENEFDFGLDFSPAKGRRGSTRSYRASQDEGFDKRQALLMFNSKSNASFGLVSNMASPVRPSSPGGRQAFSLLSNSPVPEVMQMTNM